MVSVTTRESFFLVPLGPLISSHPKVRWHVSRVTIGTSNCWSSLGSSKPGFLILPHPKVVPNTESKLTVGSFLNPLESLSHTYALLNARRPIFLGNTDLLSPSLFTSKSHEGRLTGTTLSPNNIVPFTRIRATSWI